METGRPTAMEMDWDVTRAGPIVNRSRFGSSMFVEVT